MPKFNMIIGIPGSGKTTFCKRFFKNVVYLSSDDMRIAMFGFEDQTHNGDVFSRMKAETLEALKNGRDVVYDATNLSEKRRKDIINASKKYGKVNAYILCTPISSLLERNMTRGERTLPWDKLEQMIKTIQCPMYYEGFDNIYLVDGGIYDDVYNPADLMRICYKFNQDNPYHKETLGEHIDMVVNNVEEMTRNMLVQDRAISGTAAKWHDMGKLYTKQFNETKNYYTFYGHENVSAYMYFCHLVRSTSRLHTSSKLTIVRLTDGGYRVAALILNHMKFYNGSMEKVENKFNDDDLFKMLEILHRADQEGRKSY